ncbi:MAG: hypothetical protein ACI9G1_000968 [Pirellulaceae bacterium]|jgi:hypothetical protein
MLTFKLKELFCFVAIVGVALMWWTWANGTDETANRLLATREWSNKLRRQMNKDDTIKSLGFEEWSKYQPGYRTGPITFDLGCAKSGLFAVFILSRFCSVVRAAKPAAALSCGCEPADSK